MSDITNRAEQLLAARVDSVRNLEQQRDATAEIKSQIAAAERAEAEAWSAAITAGWSPVELRKLGFTQPLTRRGGRPKSRTRSSAADNSSDQVKNN